MSSPRREGEVVVTRAASEHEDPAIGAFQCQRQVVSGAESTDIGNRLLSAAGNASLMTKELRHTLCDHAAGNYRIFIAMAAELLMTAAQRELTVLDEKLYLQVFAPPVSGPESLGAPRRCPHAKTRSGRRDCCWDGTEW